MVLFSGLSNAQHSGRLMNGRRFFAAPQATPGRRYFDRYDRLLEGRAGKTHNSRSAFVPLSANPPPR
jgi:hypothetical protein